ncbi:YidB family protein [Paenalcaligenes sp. Me131]|uniref:YidB family protein n=1 Tax=Paenalcaligenes sp. Me131 TaxID=3392636 RepID=UPI003D2A16DC
MSFLNSLMSVASAALNPAQQERASLIPALVSLVNKFPGGLNGLIQTFKQGGLAKVVASWMSSGEKLPVSMGQLEQVLGNKAVATMADDSGLSESKVLSHLTELLPTLIGAFSSSGNGSEPSGSLDVQSVIAMLMKDR